MLTDDQKARRRLGNVIKILAIEKRSFLETEKKKYPQEWERPDFIWHSILTALSSMGNSNGFKGLIENKENYNKVSFEALSEMDVSERLKVSQETLRMAKVRWPQKKAGYLAQNIEKIMKMGGPTDLSDFGIRV